MKIERIIQGKDGFKLIAFSKVIDFKGCKPQISPCKFADYKDGILRIFDQTGYKMLVFPNFKQVLKYLFSLN